MVGAAVLAVSACGTPDSSDERTAGVYAAVIAAVAEEGPGEFRALEGHAERVVYAGPLEDDVEIPLEVQVAVVEELRNEDYATVRFVDDREEAVAAGTEGEPVLEDGVLVLLGDVSENGEATVEAELYVHADDVAGFTVHADEASGDWSVTRLAEQAVESADVG